MLFYIHKTACISPQQTLGKVDLEDLRRPVDNKLKALESPYKNLPANLLRRMSKSVRMATGALLPLIPEKQFDGVIIGTANAGMEESGRFLKELVEFDEDTLSPGNFVQSTSNAIAAQISLMFGNTGYNNTHVHKGHSFENAMLDAAMVLQEHLDASLILGGIDEMASNNYVLDQQKGWFKAENFDQRDFYEPGSTGTIPGEGAAMFVIGAQPSGAIAVVKAVEMIFTSDAAELGERVKVFLDNMRADGPVDLLLSGENGNSDFAPYINTVEQLTGDNIPIARFKHLCGEYPAASGFALWLAVTLMSGTAPLTSHMIKRGVPGSIKNILIYNIHKGLQHSLIWVCSMI